MIQPNFYPFDPSTKSQWRAKAQQDLGDKDFDKTLVQSLWNTIPQDPYYNAEDWPEKPKAMSFHRESDTPGLPPRLWSNLASVSPTDEKSGNLEILQLLNNGVDGLVLQLSSPLAWGTLLDQIQFPYIEIYLQTESRDVIESFGEYFQKSTHKDLRGGILHSPFDELFSRNEDFKSTLSFAKEQLDRWDDFPAFHPICLNFARYSNSGGTGLQELCYGFGELIELTSNLEEMGISPERTFRNTLIHSAVTIQYFPEIAKLKALRLLYAQIASHFQVTVHPEMLHLICSTSTWNHSISDSHNNLIRQSTESMSAILGGCNALWTIPSGPDSSDEMQRRMAKNVSILLQEEAYLDKVIDPAAGSYYVESLIHQIQTQTQESIALLESEGGWLAAFQNRSMQQKIRSQRQHSHDLFLQGHHVGIGSNIYTNQSNSAVNISFEEIEEEDYQLKENRISYSFDQQKNL
ncbi:methylmalonyl-CoA mutase family protein [Algoriphagus vanfongensis]|uniref:methylmalonyl-CoA mutase family protein n=1 Tax=Algoriphagus vanfongensis TaxID=426371 RepID=UPI0003F97222|nr:methylmalonyl-CoA mutase family protein [Algoriphagus vanfongensis]